MATIIGSTNNSNWTFKLEVTEIGTSTAGNYSDVKVDVYIGRASSTSNCGGNFNGSVTLDGKTQNYSGVIPYPTTVAGGAWFHTGVTLAFYGVGHNADGSKTASVSATWEANFNPTSANASGSITLSNIPRQAIITSAPNFNDEENPTITYSNPAGYSVTNLEVCISLTGAVDDIPYRHVSRGANSYTFELTDEERDILRNATTTSNSRKVMFFIATTINGTIYHNAVARTFNVVNANPIFNDFEWQTTNYIDLTGNNTTVIKGYSNIKTIVSEENKATVLKKATLTSYQSTIGSKSQTNNNLTYPVETIIEKVDGASITVFANDSRGNSKAVPKPITNYIEYQKISGSITNLKRTQEVNSEVNLQFEGEIDIVDFGATSNSIVSCKYYYKNTSSSDDFILGTTTLNPTLTQIEDTKYRYEVNQNIAGDLGASGFDINNSFLIKVVVNDKLETIEDAETLGNGSPAIAIKRNCVSLGAPYNESLGGRVQINGDIYSGNLDVYLNEEQIVGTWIDGRPVYRKVVAVNFGTSSSTKINTPHNISNLHLVIKQDLIWYDTEDGGWFFDNKDKGLSDYYVCIDQVNTTDIVIKQNAYNWQNRTRNRYAILEYIKTTD